MILPGLRVLFLRLCVLILFLGLAGEAGAQPATPPPAGSQIPTVDPAALDHLIQTLQDPKTRDQFLADLKTLRAAQHKIAPQPTVVALPRALGAEILQAMSDAFARFRDGVEELRGSLGDPARLWAWLRGQVEDPGRRALLIEFLWQLVVILAGGVLADLITRYFVRRAQSTLRPPLKPRLLRRLGLLLAYSLLELAPILAFAAAAYLVVAIVQPGAAVRLALLAIVSAVVIARTAFVFCRLLLSPFEPSLRLFPLGAETAAYFYVWAVRLISLGVYGYFVLQVAVLLGLPESAYQLCLKILGLIAALLMAAVILQSREPVARLIRRGARDGEGRLPSLTKLRRQLARSWHVLALIYLVAVDFTWMMDVPGGFAYLWRGTGLTILILILAWLALALLRGGYERLFLINRDLLARYPLLDQRANRYLPLMRSGLAALIRIAAFIAILDAWRVDVGAILNSATMHEIIARAVTVFLMLVAALAIWEVVDASITFYLERQDADGRQILTSSRARTLLPLIRNALLVVISLLVALTILSELGINIAPLLAGAGVVGLAIGFGAQTLVKDVITGAFILFEDTVNIGDVVTINGVSGTVTAMSIRTLKIRDADGTLHTIPFGTLTTISNMSREFGYYSIDIGVDYQESTDKVVAAMREVFEDLRGDAAYRANILGGLDILGVDRFTDNAVRVRAGIKTRALKQWDVGREFNRRMKIRFDELGIQFAPPQRLVYGAPMASAAPPLAEKPAAEKVAS
jgi:small conductance mechanosensitive channel